MLEAAATAGRERKAMGNKGLRHPSLFDGCLMAVREGTLSQHGHGAKVASRNIIASAISNSSSSASISR